jgi:hypothetical protein
MPKRNISPEAIPELLADLACEDPDAQRKTLGLLCPCRSRCFDKDIWIAVCCAYDSPYTTERVKGQAFHALETLVERARTDLRYQELLDWLTAQHFLTLPLENTHPVRKKSKQGRKQEDKITSRDIPRLMETLDCGDPDAQQHTLKLLCPCRNPRYDRHVWLAIFRAYEHGETGQVRDQAGHAIGTLRERARTDPRSQEMLHWLAEQGVCSLPLESDVPVWQERPSPGLYIPRWERSPRSKTNRRR